MPYSVKSFKPLSDLFPNVDVTKLSRSIIIPFFNEEECVESVILEIRQAQPNAEIIAIDDGSSDGTWKKLQLFPDIIALKFSENKGQSAAMYAGMVHAHSDLIVLIDGDGQNDPSDIERLIKKLNHSDVVVGYRAKRKDKLNRRLASRIGNLFRRLVLVDGVRDTGCSVKVFPKLYVGLLVPFNGLHRYLPAIFKNANLQISEMEVNHRPRIRGTSKYTNWNRAIRGIFDLIGVAWLLNRTVYFPSIEKNNS